MNESDRIADGAGTASPGPDGDGAGEARLLVDQPNAGSSSNQKDAYSYLCIAAAVVIGSCFLFKESSTWIYFPLLMGLFTMAIALLGLIFGWSIAPFLVILVTSSCMTAAETDMAQTSRALEPVTWLICTATLAYVAGHYRLQGLGGGVFSRDLPGARTAPGKSPFSGLPMGRALEPNEVGWLVFLVATIAFATIVGLPLLPDRAQELGLKEPLWLGLVACWLLGLGLLLVRGALGYDRLRTMAAERARMILQDALWIELGGEQRRLHRGLVSARRRKEG